MMGGGGRGFTPRRFEEQYHCYSVAYADKPHLEKGDKILLPPSAFDTLARLQVDYPMLFRLTARSSSGTQQLTHCGVLEFTAEEGSCYVPFWMMQNLLIEEGTVIEVTNVSLPKATFVKLQPQHVDFLEISNPRAVLEHALRNFSCVTKGDVIQIPYNNKNYHLELKEVQPQDAACIIETDCNVDFDAPIGYKEPTSQATSVASFGSNLSNLPKQSAYGDSSAAQNRSGCPSPTASSVSASDGAATTDDPAQPPGTRIVNGQIVRQEDDNDMSQKALQTSTASMLADRSGTTGIQKNAAIPSVAPKVDYWAVNAGDGARLDGKLPAILKDKTGQEVDIRQLRAEAAARRAAAQASAGSLSEGSGILLKSGEEAAPTVASSSTPPRASRKSRTGGKFSKLKSSKAFQGSANSFG